MWVKRKVLHPGWLFIVGARVRGVLGRINISVPSQSVLPVVGRDLKDLRKGWDDEKYFFIPFLVIFLCLLSTQEGLGITLSLLFRKYFLIHQSWSPIHRLSYVRSYFLDNLTFSETYSYPGLNPNKTRRRSLNVTLRLFRPSCGFLICMCRVVLVDNGKVTLLVEPKLCLVNN